MENRRRWQRIGVVMLLATTLPGAASAQRSESAFGSRMSDFGGFVELDTRFGELMGDFAGFAGARAALRLKQRVYLGVGGAGLATDNARIPGATPGTSHRLNMGYGGILVGYAVPTREFLDLTADVLIGGGGVSLDGLSRSDEFFAFEPSVGVELRIAPVLRFGLGASYRFVGDVELQGVNDSDLRGFTGTASIRLGWF
jgi:hypothetical protein